MDTPQSHSTKERRGSWDILADMATGMVNSMELGGADNTSCSPFHPPANTKQTASLPSMHNDSTVSVPTGGRGRRSGNLMDFFAGEDEYDPSAVDLKSQARQQSTRQRRLEGINLPTWKNQQKRDPLMEFHERHNKAQDEFRKKQESEKRREQWRNLDSDDEKSVASSSSFFSFLAKAGAADELWQDGHSHDGGGGVGARGKTKRRGSNQSISSLLSLFGDNQEEFDRLSSARSEKDKAEKMKETSLQAAVDRSKSIKGHKPYSRAKQAAESGDWKKAVAYYHIALVKQRKYYGEDHLVTANTLNSLGLALMNLGEHYGALTALEEAQHIRQELLGAGAEEVAETATNIWKVLKASEGGISE